MSERLRAVRVRPLPAWLDAARLLGDGFALASDTVVEDARVAEGRLPTDAAAALAARLRGLGFDGRPLEVTVTPPLGREAVRAGRLEEARARRDVSPGFTRRGTRLDEEGRYSLTPEAIALAIGERVRGARVLDACAGSGGNSIGFARAGCEVTAIELDPARAADAAHNARLFGVERRVRVITGDARVLVPTLDADVLFLDPPWGRTYDKHAVTLATLPLLEALLPLTARFPRTLIKVPPSFDTRSVPGATAEAIFGVAVGDARRVKLVLLDLRRA